MNKLFSSGLLVFSLILIGKLTALGKDMAMSSVFGLSWEADAYFIANGAPLLVFSAFLATINVVFLPAYNKLRINKGQAIASHFANNVINVSFVLSIFLTVISVVFAEQIINLISQDIPKKVLLLSIDLAQIFSLSFVFSLFVGIYSAMQYANKSYFGTQLIPIINNICIMLAIVYFSKSYGIEVVAYVVVIAWILQVPIQRRFLKSKFKHEAYINIKDKDLKLLFLLAVPAFFGFFVDQINILVDLYLSSGLSEGSVAALSYAYKLVMLVSLFFPLIVTSVVYPYFSDCSVNNTEGLEELFEKSVKSVLLLIGPIFLATMIFGEQMISLVFERGLFDSNATEATSEIFTYYAISILFIGLREVFNKLLFAQQKTKIILCISSFSVIVNIILSVILVRLYGVVGIALATSISVALHAIIQMLIIHHVIGIGLTRKYIKFFLDFGLALAFMLFVMVLLNKYFIANDFIWLAILCLSITGYMVILYIRKQSEFMYVLEFIKSYYK